MKRLHDRARGWAIADIVIENHPKDCIKVGVWLLLEKLGMDKAIHDVRSEFHQPCEFRLRDVHNEIDEIAEQAKKIEKQVRHTRTIWNPLARAPRMALMGTGLRGRWKKDDEMSAPKTSSGG
jgi:hypothetical protein